MKHALLETWPGRLLVAGAAVKMAVALLGVFVAAPPIGGVLDTIASFALVGGALYFLARAVSSLARRFLWRVRRRLVLSYIFVGFIPALLIVVFFLLSGLLLFSTFGAYMLETRLRALAGEAAAAASAVVVDVERISAVDPAAVLSHRAEGSTESLAIVPLSAPCRPAALGLNSAAGAPVIASSAVVDRGLRAGPWTHTSPPSAIPAWMSCGNFQGLLAYGERSADEDGSSSPAGANTGERSALGLVARAVAFAPRYAVVVDIPVRGQAIEQLWRDTGVELAEVRAIGSRTPVLAGQPPGLAPAFRGSTPTLMFPDLVDWESGEVRSGVVFASIRLGLADMYRHMSAAQGAGARQTVGQGLLLVLMGVGILFLVIEGAALFVGFALARSITGSVHELFTGTERVRRGDFSHKIAVRARDQLGALATSFNSMTDSIETLLGEQAEKKRLEEELRIAHDIQMSLLPQGPLDTPGLSVTAISVPAREVGGDYYDLFNLGDGRVGLLVADVSGKGTSAALYMAELKGLMLSLSRIHSSPRALLIAANCAITGHLDPRSFITMTYAVIDVPRRIVTFARAGHTPLVFLPAAGGTPKVRVLTPDGLALGMDTGDDGLFERLLREDTIAIEANDLLVLFTDGISEAMNAQNDCYSEARLGRLLEEHAQLSGEAIRERVLSDVAAFTGDSPQHDDMTLILVRIGKAVERSVANSRDAIDAGGRVEHADVAAGA